MRKLLAFLQLTRPLFLVGGVLLYALGAAMALVNGYPLQPGSLLAGQALVSSVQLMTHYFNEYFDLESDRLNNQRTWFSGGSGVLARGMLSPGVARQAGILFTGAALLSLFVAGCQVPIIFLLGGAALVGAWSYSAPPLALVRTGWGEFCASLVVAGMVPLVGYALQSGGRVSIFILITILPLVLIHYAMLVAFQIPDRKADAAVGKQTISVRLSYGQVVRVHNGSLLAAFCVILILALIRWPGARFAWLALPLAFWQAASLPKYAHTATPKYQWLTMRAIGLFALTTTLWLTDYLLILAQK